MKKSRDGNLRELRITDPEALFLVSRFSKESRRSPTSAATLVIVKALRRFRPEGDSIPENRHWQQENLADAGSDQKGGAE